MDDFEEFAAAAIPGLHRTAWLLTHDAHRAEDLVQETLTRMYVKAHRRGPRGRIDHPLAYARRTMLRLHLDERRRKRSGEIPVDAVPDAAAPAADLTATLTLREALDELKPTDRAIVVLRFYEDLTHAEIGDLLGLSEAAVRTRTSRAMGRLRQTAALSDHHPPHEPQTLARRP
ncbi:sigma-70 family RNA polymerase sigma factor [Nocardioides sp. GXZ039]|uniref:sigma-70 family RNA polymerase sigma factor n=1 Tax=Nocardioides sp. GXZ039 TaxID=3136018 RepID=UPI0030F37FEA